MPSQNTKWSKDKQLIDYLDYLRQKNLEMWSVCHFCEKKSVGITAVKEKLYSVCEEHDVS
jgi:hypothetical protein